jgi:hypothetical protein
MRNKLQCDDLVDVSCRVTKYVGSTLQSTDEGCKASCFASMQGNWEVVGSHRRNPIGTQPESNRCSASSQLDVRSNSQLMTSKRIGHRFALALKKGRKKATHFTIFKKCRQRQAAIIKQTIGWRNVNQRIRYKVLL